MKASHKHREILIGQQVVKLEPGQFVTGRNSLAEDFNFGMKPKERIGQSTVWRWLQTLEKMGNLNIKTNNKFSLVTIDKWGFYQGEDEESEQHFEHQMNNKWTTNEHQMNTNKNVKNIENVNNEKKENNNTTTDNPAKRIWDFWDANGFGYNNLNAKEKLAMFLDDGFDADVILRALEIASENNKISFNYVNTVLLNWDKRNLKTLEAVNAAEAEFKKQIEQKHQQPKQHYKKGAIRTEQLPDWFNEEDKQPDKPKPKEDAKSKQSILDQLKEAGF